MKRVIPMTMLNRIPLSVSDTIAKLALSNIRYGTNSNEYEHSVRVKNRVREIIGRYFKYPSTEMVHYIEHLALMHDVVESRKITLLELTAIYPKPFIIDLGYLTRQEDESYAEYKTRLISSKSFEVYVTKLADNFENSEWPMEGFEEKRIIRLTEEYRTMRLELLQALDEYGRIVIVSSPWSKTFD